MITVLDSVNLDLTEPSNGFLRRGKTVLGQTFRMAPGGKGADQALAARRAGASVRMVGAREGAQPSIPLRAEAAAAIGLLRVSSSP